MTARIAALGIVAALAGPAMAASAAEPVMIQCGREYQAAKAAGTLAGQDWDGYRTSCAARLKGTPPAAPVAASTPAPSPPPVAASSTPAAAGLSAMHERQKQCGAEWRAQKATLVVQTPGLTWPRYWSLCNARLKAVAR